ncbi:MAG: alkaline phosphatase family protein [Chloroflexi bacterium]|nr:alkaline phosphatase family protein [Chloroflexota bacterium]
MNPTFVKPRYDAGGFAGIPQRIRDAFASEQYDAVVLFLVDGFGWRFFERFQDVPFLRRVARDGRVEKLTSQFPSTTAAHITTIHTGLPVGESGVYEWFFYEPSLDRIITPLLFSRAGDTVRDTLKKFKVDPATLYPTRTFYQELVNLGVRSHVFGLRDYTPSTYSLQVMRGADLHAFRTLPEALVNLGLEIEKQTSPSYFHFYFDKVDGICHEYGPNAPQLEAEIETFLLVLENFFARVFKSGKRVLFLLTADHGASEVDPRTTIFLNADPRFKGVEHFFRSNHKGELLVPAGSARDMFLHVKDGLIDEAQYFLATRLVGKADVAKVQELIEDGYFGPTISPEFRARVGNLVILPYRGEAVWWFVKDKFEQKFYGHHGGLTPQEMEIPLLRLEV